MHFPRVSLPAKPSVLLALAFAAGCGSLPPPIEVEAAPAAVAVAAPAPAAVAVAGAEPAPAAVAVAGEPPPEPEPEVPAEIPPYNDAPRLSPVIVPGVTGATRLAVSAISTCALVGDGEAMCWGNYPLDLQGRTATIVPSPARMRGWKSVRSLADGEGAVFAILADGRLQGHYQLTPNLYDLREFHLGRKHPCAITSRDVLQCWEEYRVGIEPPVLTLQGIAQVDSKFHHACALTVGGQVLCWGEGSSGQLGDGAAKDRAAPVPVLGLKGAAQVSIGGQHSCARTADGAVHCWGLPWSVPFDNHDPALDRPAPVPGLAGVVQIAAGAYHTCALLRDGGVHCWGRNDNGELGDGTTEDRLAPARVPGLPPAVEIAAYTSHTCARLLGGRVACWGSNSHGQIGAP